MKKYIILLIFNFSLIFAKEIKTENFDDLFEETYIEEEVKEEKIKDIKIIQGMKVANLNPALINDVYSSRVVKFVYDNLFIKNKNGDIEPYLVDNYHWINEKELYLELRDDVYFHNNDRLTSIDVKNSLAYLKYNGNLGRLFSEIINIKIIDNRKLIIKLSEENNIFLEMLTYNIASIFKIKDGKIYGTGEYFVKSFEKNRLVLKRFDKYFKENHDVENIYFSYEIQDSQRLISLFNEKVDVALDIDNIALNYGEKYNIISDETIKLQEKGIKTLALVFGNKNNYTYEEKKAIENIIDREATSFFPFKLSKEEFSKIDIVNSNEKFPENIKLKSQMDLMVLNTDKNIKEANKIKEAFEKYNIQINILPHNLESYNINLKDKNFDLTLYNISMVGEEVVFNIAKIFLNDLENREVYNSLKPFFKILKEEKRKEKREIILDKILQLIYKELPYIPILHYRDYIVISPKYKNQYDEWEKR